MPPLRIDIMLHDATGQGTQPSGGGIPQLPQGSPVSAMAGATPVVPAAMQTVAPTPPAAATGAAAAAGGGTPMTMAMMAMMARNNNEQQTVRQPSRIAQAEWVGTQIAQNKGGEVLLAGIDKAAAGLSMLGPVGMAAGGALTVFTGGVRAADAVIKELNANAQRLAYISPQISTANAVNQVKTIGADIRENNYSGDQFARLLETQNDMDITVRETFYPIKNWLLESLGDFIEWLKEKLLSIQEYIVKGQFAIMELGSIIKDSMQFHFEQAGGRIEHFRENMDKKWQEFLSIVRKNDGADLIDDFFKVLGSGPRTGPVGPLPNPGGGGLRLPINQGQ
jgi:hypothetical protein